MKQRFSLLTAALLLGLFAGCEADESFDLVDSATKSPTAEEISPINKLQEEEALPDYFLAQLEEFDSLTLNTYTVKFMGRVGPEAGANTTTFNYEVKGNGFTPQSDSFTLELPGCAGNLATWTPLQPTTVSQNAIKWNNSISKDGTQQYSVTYNGDIPLGIISATLTRGGISETKDIVGPCQGVYTISGSIYNDLNLDGDKQDSESGISGFFIDLFDANNKKMATVSTSGDGSYSFMVLAGNYKVSVSNELLSVGDILHTIENLKENRFGYNFGYSVSPTKIIGQLEEKIIVVNTKPTKFWVQEIKNAGRKNGLYSKEVIIGWLEEIEAKAKPFNFGTDKVASALDFLSRPINSDLDAFLRQLLTAELNVVSGKGALLDPLTNTTTLNEGFNSALLIYSEGVACESGICNAETVSTTSRAAEIKAVRSTDTKMLLSFNGSGGV